MGVRNTVDEMKQIELSLLSAQFFIPLPNAYAARVALHSKFLFNQNEDWKSFNTLFSQKSLV